MIPKKSFPTYRSISLAKTALESRLRRTTNSLQAASRKLKSEIVRRKGFQKSLAKSERHHSALLNQSRQMQEHLRQLTHQILTAQEDERRDSRIVEEIVDNACKFSRQGTPIHVQLGNDGAVVVTDQGRGMTPKQINQIGAFKQFDRKRYEQQGLGLGLLLVQKLTHLHGAKLDIASEPGSGTRVQIAFPLTKHSA